MTPSLPDDTFRDLVREAVSDALLERQDFLREIVFDALEDIGLSRAIDEGAGHGFASREEVFALIDPADAAPFHRSDFTPRR